MSVEGHKAATMIDHHRIAITAHPASINHRTGISGHNGLPIVGTDIDSGMEDFRTPNGVDAPAKRRRDFPITRPGKLTRPVGRSHHAAFLLHALDHGRNFLAVALEFFVLGIKTGFFR